MKVSLLKVGHVDKRHSSHIKGKQEKVTCKCLCGAIVQIQGCQPPDIFYVDCSLAGLVDSRVDIFEWIAVLGQAFPKRPVVDGPKDAHIKGCRVCTKSGFLKASFETRNKLIIDAGKPNVLILPESLEPQ